MSDEGKELLKRAVGIARADGPSAEQSARIARAIGVVPVFPPPSAPPPAVVAATSGAAAGTSAAMWIGIGGIAAVIAVGIGVGVAWPSEATQHEAAPVEAQTVESAAVESVEPAVESAAVDPAMIEVGEEPVAPTEEARARPRARVRPRVEPAAIQPAAIEAAAIEPPETTAQSHAREEAALIQRAESALRRDPRTALRLANDHEQRFPSGLLGQEREVIRIEALLALGQRSAAEQRARVFDLSHRGSLHSRRIHRLLDAQ